MWTLFSVRKYWKGKRKKEYRQKIREKGKAKTREENRYKHWRFMLNKSSVSRSLTISTYLTSLCYVSIENTYPSDAKISLDYQLSYQLPHYKEKNGTAYYKCIKCMGRIEEEESVLWAHRLAMGQNVRSNSSSKSEYTARRMRDKKGENWCPLSTVTLRRVVVSYDPQFNRKSYQPSWMASWRQMSRDLAQRTGSGLEALREQRQWTSAFTTKFLAHRTGLGML